jgi:arsenate reductase (thioredoxin)
MFEIIMKNHVLFVCVHNSARSQIAESVLRRECGDSTSVESAGLTPGILNPFAVEALREIGIDISGKQTRDVFEVYNSGARFTHVITVCDGTSAEQCPIFPGAFQQLNWNFPDPSKFGGSPEERLQHTREVRNQIEQKIFEWCKENCTVTA